MASPNQSPQTPTVMVFDFRDADIDNLANTDSSGAATTPNSGKGQPQSSPGSSGRRKTKTRRKHKKARVTINLSNCKYPVVFKIVKELGFKEVGDTDDWILFWSDQSVSSERLMAMRPYQRVNHFPWMHLICRKVPLALNLERMSKLFPEEYSYAPKSFTLPEDLSDFESLINSAKKPKTWILKPSAGCQGKGVTLCRSLEEVKSAMDMPEMQYVVQQYIANPLLIDSFKFDLRLYALVVSATPLRVFLYREGMARFCTEPYKKPTAENLSNTFMHLTNYAVNKKSDVFETDSDSGFKRLWSTVRDHLQSSGVDTVALWDRIADVVVKTLILVQPRIEHEYQSNRGPQDLDGRGCFELLGFDIMIDRKLKPWLIEVNHSPSFSVDTEIDTTIKESLIRDTLVLVKLSPNPRIKYLKEQRNQSRARLTRGATPLIDKEVEEVLYERRKTVYENYEMKHSGAYDLVYPSEDRVQRFKDLFVDNVAKPVDTALSLERRKIAARRKLSEASDTSNNSGGGGLLSPRTRAVALKKKKEREKAREREKEEKEKEKEKQKQKDGKENEEIGNGVADADADIELETLMEGEELAELEEELEEEEERIGEKEKEKEKDVVDVDVEGVPTTNEAVSINSNSNPVTFVGAGSASSSGSGTGTGVTALNISAVAVNHEEKNVKTKIRYQSQGSTATIPNISSGTVKTSPPPPLPLPLSYGYGRGNTRPVNASVNRNISPSHGNSKSLPASSPVFSGPSAVRVRPMALRPPLRSGKKTTVTDVEVLDRDHNATLSISSSNSTSSSSQLGLTVKQLYTVHQRYHPAPRGIDPRLARSPYLSRQRPPKYR